MFGTVVLVIIILILVIVTVWMVNKSKKKDKAPVWPPAQYMKNVGGRCPDYYTYMGISGGKDVCKNTFNIPTENNKCTKNNSYSFSTYKKWPPTGNALKSRCNWMKQCGPSKDIPVASWTGLDQYCDQEG